jgi:hypothetical protein
MTTLTIKDLTVSEGLGSTAMIAVRGGNTLDQPVITQHLGMFPTDDKSGAGGKGGGKSNSGAGHYLTYTIEPVLISNYQY